MFNFIVFDNTDGSTTALLCDENRQPMRDAFYCVTFAPSDRRTRVNCYTYVGDEHKRLSVCNHVHSEKHIGAVAVDAVVYQD